MARANYGPEAKKRTKQLFTVLLDYANDELDCDETGLDGLQQHIQIHWQTEQRLIVRTKVRFLEALTKLALEKPLTGEHIKESLRRLTDFLQILEDNRPNRGGSEVWHFTVQLWYKRSDRTANLERFDQEWEQQRSQLKRAEQKEQTEDDWWQMCRHHLQTQHYHRLTTNPLTIGDGVAFDLDEVYVPLGLIERKQRDRRESEIPPDRGSQLYESEEAEENEVFSPKEFVNRLREVDQLQRIAILGEPGSGKTTLLQKIAGWLLEGQQLPIWVSLADLQDDTLENYLLKNWLKAATRKVSVSAQQQAEFAEQFHQGRVWLLLDAIDEMAMDSTQALSRLARQLRGWIADAHIILTCRLNVWDAGKNALEVFTTYRNLPFSYGRVPVDQVSSFIGRWFQHNPALGERLHTELNKPERKRIKDMVKNPLRLALLCRSWWQMQGNLPNTKAILYQQFVETIYEWKQDCFPTTIAQRQQLNQALGQLALQAMTQSDTKFRLRHSFVVNALGEKASDLLPLALQLGWLNQVGILAGEKVYAFYHPTFQEYFTAQAIANYSFFLEMFPPTSDWREVILLWFGRPEIDIAQKESLMQVLIQFEDGCGGFYRYQTYFFAAAAVGEFSDYTKSKDIINQLLCWRFGEFNHEQQNWNLYPSPVQEGARVALLQTDRTQAISLLEQFIQSITDLFALWNAAYSLGRSFDPGNSLAIAVLTQLLDTFDSPTIRLQICDALGKVDPGNCVVISTFAEIIAANKQNSLGRKAAYYLGKIDTGNVMAIATLVNMIESGEYILKRQAAENLEKIDPGNQAAAILQLHQVPTYRKIKSSKQGDINRAIAALEERLAYETKLSTQRKLAYQLGRLHPGHSQSIKILLQLLQSQQSISYQQITQNLKEIILEEQLAMVVTTLSNWDFALGQHHIPQICECYKLLWYCAQRMSYESFHKAWNTSYS